MLVLLRRTAMVMLVVAVIIFDLSANVSGHVNVMKSIHRLLVTYKMPSVSVLDEYN